MKKNLFIISFIVFSFLFTICKAQPVQQEWVARYMDTSNSNCTSVGIGLDHFGNVYVGGMAHTQFGKFVAVKYNNNETQQWIGKYSGTNSNNSVYCFAMAVDSSGNEYLTGTIGPTFGNTDLLTIRFNSSTGDTMWTRRYSGPFNLGASSNAIGVDLCGNIYVAGGCGNTSYANPMVVKYDPQGNMLWVRNLNITFNSDLYACAFDDSCNIYATGYNGGNALTLKYSANGNLQWYKVFATYGSGGRCIAIDSLGNCFVGGYAVTGVSDADLALFKYDRLGNFQWASYYIMPINRSAAANSVSVNRSGTYVATGGYAVFNKQDYLTISFNAITGDSIWVRTYSGTASCGLCNDVINAIVMDKFNNLYVTGTVVDLVTGTNYATIKYSQSGQQQWVIKYDNGNTDDEGNGIVIDNNYNVYVTGFSQRQQGGIFDLATIKYSQPVGVNQLSTKIPNAFKLYQNYPNPFNPTTKIKFDVPSTGHRYIYDLHLVVYDVLGREVASLVNDRLHPGSYEVEWDASNFPSGVYFYRLFSNNQIIDTKKLILIK